MRLLFALSKILWPLAQHDVILLVIAIIGVTLGWTRYAQAGRWMTLAATCALAAVAALPIDQWLLAPLEERFPPPRELPAYIDGIIALGGAIDPELSARYGMPSLNEHAERMTTFVKLARLYPSAKLVFSGGSASLFVGRPAEADAAKLLFKDLGLDPAKIVFEDQSRNTYENAIFSKRLVNPKPGEIWVLITSAEHMSRSVGIFRRAGWPVIPWPVAYKSGGGYELQLGGHLKRLDLAVHEWLGLLAYRLLDRTDALFPAP